MTDLRALIADIEGFSIAEAFARREIVSGELAERLILERAAVIVALRSALLPQPMEGWVMLPCEPDEDLIRAMNDGYRSVRRQGASGMSIDAQWRAEYGPEIAAYRALLAASPSPPKDESR